MRWGCGGRADEVRARAAELDELALVVAQARGGHVRIPPPDGDGDALHEPPQQVLVRVKPPPPRHHLRQRGECG